VNGRASFDSKAWYEAFATQRYADVAPRMEIAVPERNWFAAIALDGRLSEFRRVGFRISELNEDEVRAMNGAGEQEEERESDSGPAHSYLAV